MRRFLAILIMLLSLSGCTSTRTYNSLAFLPEDHKLSRFSSISAGVGQVGSSVLGAYFTPAAHKAVKDIPVIDGLMFRPFVVGVNFWSSLGGVLLFNGCERKVVISRRFLLNSSDPETILHEYIHHLDDLDRDGEGEWIDHREFVLAFHRLMQDEIWGNEARRKLKRSDSFITNTFGVGPMSELIAYIGTWVAGNWGPAYMKRVYREILKN